MKSKYDFLIGVPLLAALLACGGSSEKVVVESPDDPEPVYVPASNVQPAPAKTKVKKTYPDGTTIETERTTQPPPPVEVEIDD